MSFRVRYAALTLAVCLCGVLGYPPGASAQTITDERAWFTFMVQPRPSPDSPWGWSVEAIFRSRDGVEELDLASVRPIVTYRLTQRSSVGGGYAFVSGFPKTGGTVIEHRPFGQYIWAGPAAGGTLTFRTRLEARFVEGNSGEATRVRQQVRFSHPVRSGSRLSVVGYDELFVHFNTTTLRRNGVDQNRAFVGMADTMSRSIRMEIGYVNQYAPGYAVSNRMNHVLSGVLVVSF